MKKFKTKHQLLCNDCLSEKMECSYLVGADSNLISIICLDCGLTTEVLREDLTGSFELATFNNRYSNLG